MSKNKEFSSTSASRYSLALYELAEEANLLSQIEENSAAYLSLIDQSKEFNSFLKDPTLGQNILTNINNKISNSFKLENLFRNFLNFLILKRRYFYTEKILKSFIPGVNLYFGINFANEFCNFNVLSPLIKSLTRYFLFNLNIGAFTGPNIFPLILFSKNNLNLKASVSNLFSLSPVKIKEINL